MVSPALAASRWTTSSAERRLRGRLVAGRYRIEQLVGAGAMAYVYRALHVELGVPCAVKVIREPAPPRGRGRADAGVLRFQIEARAVARLDHPNVVRMLDFGRDDEVDLWYLVTEHLDGQDLLDVLNAETTLPVLRVVAIARQLCAALEHAHGAGVIHRDVKPENLRVIPRRTAEGAVEHVKLLDFGTARIVGDIAGDPPQFPGAPAERAAGAEELERPVIGTPAYMSPEQATGRRADARSDIYSSGVVLYEMATGRLPFERPTPIALAAAHVESPPPLPRDVRPDIDPDLEAVILWCLRKDPAARPQSARALDDALADVARAARRRA